MPYVTCRDIFHDIHAADAATPTLMLAATPPLLAGAPCRAPLVDGCRLRCLPLMSGLLPPCHTLPASLHDDAAALRAARFAAMPPPYAYAFDITLLPPPRFAMICRHKRCRHAAA